ncbi:MAG: aspartate ammonia-lyase [Candidatus Diapherotrites archaeon]|nr:aspartate ammonia-lyase [Candidatus Diapherotrites archaeon]
MNFRTEKDSLGIKKLPENAYYGIFTQRAKENFQLTDLMPSNELMASIGLIKLASAETNYDLNLLDLKKFNAIKKACNEFIQGKFENEFCLDYFQAGAGTPFNMNANEVIANRATELLGGKKGTYLIHPNNDVNKSQSSNDVIPTAVRLVVLMHSEKLLKEIELLKKELKLKEKEFNKIIKCGRTHFMDAVPITLGQEFSGYTALMDSAINSIKKSCEELKEIPLGGTAIGTGIASHPKYRKKVVLNLSKLTGFKLRKAKNNFELMHSMNAFVDYSNALRMLSNSLIKISNDLMILSSGPKTGLNELILLEVEPGSSIMPGKVNPSILEAVKMACFYVHGMDLTVNRASQDGVLEINVNTPIILYSLESSIILLTNTIEMLSMKCIKGIKSNKNKCIQLLNESYSFATALNPYLGYSVLAELIKEAEKKHKSIKEIIKEKNFLSEKELNKILSFNEMTAPRKTDKKLIEKIQNNENYKSYLNKLKN